MGVAGKRHYFIRLDCYKFSSNRRFAETESRRGWLQRWPPAFQLGRHLKLYLGSVVGKSGQL